MEQSTKYGVISGVLFAGIIVTIVAHSIYMDNVRAELQTKALQEANQKAAELKAAAEKQAIKNMIDSNYQSCLEVAALKYHYDWALECVEGRYTYNLDCRLYSGELIDSRYVERKRECQVTWQHENDNPTQVTSYQKPTVQKYCIAKPGVNGKVTLTADNSTCVTAPAKQLEDLQKAIRKLIRAQAAWE